MINLLKPKKKRPLKFYKQKAWNAFSKYIRLHCVVANEYGHCYTCGLLTHYKDLQAGHWIEGHSNMVYINEDYVRPQCRGCNIFKKGNLGEFRDRIRKELGNERVDDLILQSRQIRKLTAQDYIDLYEKYVRLLKQLQ